ncbi:protein of unknown function [Micromonospora nigra]|uniref:DUF4192 domain-containing protein n=1 Tax=Micromonospora nigra TaxID=145857 RepID=A0A1C6RZ21_9ACTN|nr:DUF4192 domain-containing protein [Micromonospora nigra]SCL22481.1 protein of unknown function [Micromonospora nigra]
MTPSDRPRLAVRSPADLIAAVPYLLGFHPADSVVVVALSGPRITFVARADLPRAADDPSPPARHLAEVVARQGVESATVIGYGAPTRVTPAVDAVRVAFAVTGLPVVDALRVTAGRWWSYLCAEPECCPPDGTPYDAQASAVPAAAVFAGQVALPDRAALAAQVAPASGTDTGGATARAELRLAELLGRARPLDRPVGPSDDRLLREAGVDALRVARRRQRDGGSLTDDEVAWLGLLLTYLPVRDHAWQRTDGRDADIALWTDVLRRADPELIAAPASLLAFAAWRAGQGALAAVALERALARHPTYSLALTVDDLLRRGVPPEVLDGWPAVELPGVVRRRRRRRGRTTR